MAKERAGGSSAFPAQQVLLLAVGIVVLLAAAAYFAFDNSRGRARSANAAHATLASQLPTQLLRLARAAGPASRGQLPAFAELRDSREQFANDLRVLQAGGVAQGVEVPGAGGTEETRRLLDELARRWPELANASSTILAAQRELVALGQNVAQARTGAEEMSKLSQELTALMIQAGSAPQQVQRASRLALLAERLGRGATSIAGAEMIDPEVAFLLGKDTNEAGQTIRALEDGNEALGIQALRDGESRAKLAELKKQFGELENNVNPILRDLQKVVAARQSGASIEGASEPLNAALARLQAAIQAEHLALRRRRPRRTAIHRSGCPGEANGKSTSS